MTTRKRKNVEASLLRKGFVLDETDHRCYIFKVENRVVAMTKVSRDTQYKDLHSDLIAKMARQCSLTKYQFLELVDCSMSKDDYKEHLRKQKLLE